MFYIVKYNTDSKEENMKVSRSFPKQICDAHIFLFPCPPGVSKSLILCLFQSIPDTLFCIVGWNLPKCHQHLTKYLSVSVWTKMTTAKWHVQKHLQDIIHTKIEDVTMEVVHQNPSSPCHCWFQTKSCVAPKNCVVIYKVSPEHFFNRAAVPVDDGSNPNQLEIEIDGAVFHVGNRNEDINFSQNQGLAVDDDNESATDTWEYPTRTNHILTLIQWPKLGFWWSYCRAVSVSIDWSPSVQDKWSPKKKSLMDVFVKMTPYNFLDKVIMVKTSFSSQKWNIVTWGRGIYPIYWNLVDDMHLFWVVVGWLLVVIEIWWQDNFIPNKNVCDMTIHHSKDSTSIDNYVSNVSYKPQFMDMDNKYKTHQDTFDFHLHSKEPVKTSINSSYNGSRLVKSLLEVCVVAGAI